MKQNFEKVYEDICKNCPKNVVNSTNIIHAKKQKFNKIAIIVLSIIIAILFGIFLYLRKNGLLNELVYSSIAQLVISLLIGFVIISAVINGVVFSKDNGYLLANYIKYVATPLTKSVFPDGKYLPNAGISVNTYNARLYNDDYDRFYSSNLISDDKSHIVFSIVHTEIESKDSDGNSTYSTNFFGLAGKKTLDKNIKTTFSVLTNGSAFLSSDRVKLDSKNFEKYFDIDADDKVMAMRFLTSDVMEKILDLKTNFNYDFEFGIINDTLYFRISLNDNIFSNYEKDFLNKDNMYYSYAILDEVEYLSNFVDKITDDLEI